MAAIYRISLIFLLSVLLISYFLPWGFAYDNNSIAALRWLGANALVSEKEIIASSKFITMAYAAAYIGMIFYKRWARMLLLAISLLGGVAISLFGMSVQSGYESMLGYFATLGDGFIIALSFFSELKSKFHKGR